MLNYALQNLIQFISPFSSIKYKTIHSFGLLEIENFTFIYNKIELQTR